MIMRPLFLIVLLVCAACASTPRSKAVPTTSIASDIEGPWTVVGEHFFNADSLLFTPDGRVRITRDGKLRRGTWSVVDGLLEVKGIDQSTRFQVGVDGGDLTLRVMKESRGAWRDTEDEVRLKSARVLPAARPST